jgi:hypothetical protein
LGLLIAWEKATQLCTPCICSTAAGPVSLSSPPHTRPAPRPQSAQAQRLSALQSREAEARNAAAQEVASAAQEQWRAALMAKLETSQEREVRGPAAEPVVQTQHCQA